MKKKSKRKRERERKRERKKERERGKKGKIQIGEQRASWLVRACLRVCVILIIIFGGIRAKKLGNVTYLSQNEFKGIFLYLWSRIVSYDHLLLFLFSSRWLIMMIFYLVFEDRLNVFFWNTA